MIESAQPERDIVPLVDEPIDPLAGYAARAAFFGRTPESLFGAIDVGRIGALVDGRGRTGLAATIAEHRPDALVCDFFLFGALAAGESAGVPTAALVHNSSVNWPLPGVPLPPPGSLPMRGPLGWMRDQAWAISYNRIARREGLRFVNEARARLGLACRSAAPRTGRARGPRPGDGERVVRVGATGSAARERASRRGDPDRGARQPGIHPRTTDGRSCSSA